MNDNYTEPELQQIDKAQRLRGYWYIVIGLVLAVLTVGIYFALQRAGDADRSADQLAEQARERDEKIENLGTALEAQRQQFRDCMDKKASAPGCQTPVAPPASSIGPPGPPGDPGITGATGPRGPVGPTGPTGPRGPMGLRGVQGLPGEEGADGSPGPKGDKGDKGEAGTGQPGSDGAKGDPGADGKPGETGPQGVQGERGPEGERGPDGPPGPTGPQGTTGTSAPIVTGILFGTDPTNCVLIFQFDTAPDITVPAPTTFCTPA